jgi:hypothetical protein
MLNRCPITKLSVSYAYKRGCRCSSCKENKSIYTKRDVKVKERYIKWKLTNPQAKVKIKEYGKKYQDKLWISRFNELVKQTDYKCQICGVTTGLGTMSYKGRLHIDHCHKTGKVRGLLCGNCNVGLGHFKDSVELLQQAAEYLKENGDVY